MLFESILISLVNKEQNIILICFSIKQKYILIFTIVYICFIFGNIFLIMIPPCYAYLYYKWLSKNLAVSDEVVFKWENRHCTTTLKNIFGENFIINKNNGANCNNNNQSNIVNVENEKKINMVTFANREAIITRFDISIESKQTSQKNKGDNYNKQNFQLISGPVVDINA
jgi:hypothetical protein